MVDQNNCLTLPKISDIFTNVVPLSAIYKAQFSESSFNLLVTKLDTACLFEFVILSCAEFHPKTGRQALRIYSMLKWANLGENHVTMRNLKPVLLLCTLSTKLQNLKRYRKY